MKILFIAMSDSIHTARWLSQITDQGWDIHLFPSIDLGEMHPEIQNVTVHHTFFTPGVHGNSTVKMLGTAIFSKHLASWLRSLFRLLNPHKRAKQLARLLQELKPDIVHTLETQHAGYLLTEALAFDIATPKPWVHSIWGSDLFYFGRFPEHQAQIRQVLTHCTHLICEGNRDVQIARFLGYSGIMLPNMQATGGFDLQMCERLSSHLPPSKRHLIVLKGYESWSGRALTALRGLRLCKDVLAGYTLAVIHARPGSPVAIAATRLAQEAKLNLRLVPIGVSHDTILKLYGEARLSLSIAISDGVPNSLLESMAMGAFPIQSDASCADEWVKDGKTGCLVPADNPEKIAQSVRRAVQDDALVDSAATQNASVIHTRQNILVNQKQTVKMYETLAIANPYA